MMCHAPCRPGRQVRRPVHRRRCSTSGSRPRRASSRGAQKNETSSFLPGSAESVKALDAVKKYPGGELAPAVIVFERPGGLPPPTSSGSTARRPEAQPDRPPLVLEAQKPVYSREREGGDHRPARRARRRPGGQVRGRGAVDPRQGRRARQRPRGQGHRRGGLQPRRDQGLRVDQRQPAAGRGGDRPRPADHHLPLADLLGDPVLQRAAGRGRVTRHRLSAGRGGRDHQRPDRRHPARARVRRRHRLRAAARLAATGRSCEGTRTSTRRWRSPCAVPARRSWRRG